MPVGAGGVLVMLMSFVLTFIVARVIAKWFWRNRARKTEERERASESRQVRRARERRRN